MLEEVCGRADVADLHFAMEELPRFLKRGDDTAPRADGVINSMLFHVEPTGERHMLNLLNLSWDEWRLPVPRKTAVIQLIPKAKDTTSLRPISLLSCLGKMAERMVLSRLKWRTGPLNLSLFAYLPQASATDCLATFLWELRRGLGMAVVIDLKKAFELANSPTYLAALARKGDGGRLLSWVKDLF